MSDDDGLPSIAQLLSNRTKRTKASLSRNDKVTSFFGTCKPATAELVNCVAKRESAHLPLPSETEPAAELEAAMCLLPAETPVFVEDRSRSMMLPAKIMKSIANGSSKGAAYQVQLFDGTLREYHEQYIIAPDSRRFYTGKALPLAEAIAANSPIERDDDKQLALLDPSEIIACYRGHLEAIALGTTASRRDAEFHKSIKTRAALYSQRLCGRVPRTLYEQLLERLISGWLHDLLQDEATATRLKERFRVSELANVMRQYTILVIQPELMIRMEANADSVLAGEEACPVELDAAERRIIELDRSRISSDFVQYLYSCRSLLQLSRSNSSG